MAGRGLCGHFSVRDDANGRRLRGWEIGQGREGSYAFKFALFGMDRGDSPVARNIPTEHFRSIFVGIGGRSDYCKLLKMEIYPVRPYSDSDCRESRYGLAT